MKNTAKKSVLGKRFAFNLVLFGFIGQIAWNVENMYFNTFLYNAVYNGASQHAVDNSINVIDAVSYMVAFSAVAAVLTTFIMGTLSDRKGSRKRFISFGYIIWGLITAAFALITRDNLASILRLSDEIKILTASVWSVIIMDCIMTFVGSTANDACFNAWVTDSTTNENRASAESVLAILPFGAMGVVLGLGGVLLAGEDKSKSYATFFLLLGAVVTVCGIIGLFTLKEPQRKPSNSESYVSDLLYGLRFSVIKENSKFYLTLSAMCIYSVAMQVFFPYLIIYLQHSPDKFFAAGNLQITPALIVVALVAVVGVIAGILGAGKFIDKFGKDTFILPMLIWMAIGLAILYFAHNLITVIIGAVPMAIGYCLVGIMLGSALRDFTPKDKAGLFQGVRIIFCVTVPMILGPAIGKNAILNSGAKYIDDYGVAQSVPTSSMFLYAAITCIFAIIPIAVILKKGGFTPEKERGLNEYGN